MKIEQELITENTNYKLNFTINNDRIFFSR